jgi:hypothetical protein
MSHNTIVLCRVTSSDIHSVLTDLLKLSFVYLYHFDNLPSCIKTLPNNQIPYLQTTNLITHDKAPDNPHCNMTLIKTALLSAMLAMAPVANAHMVMAHPVPFGSPNNSPLDPSGFDFPCKVGGGGSGSYEVKTMNEWPVGSTQTLDFTGTAVHGGGSCQLSVTADKVPSPTSVWKVIHSFEGGCPAAVDGNFNEDGSNGGPGKFPFTVPTELPNGEMTVAWTWFNKIGNREMYMNCAPITVSGGSDDTTGFKALPEMAVANIQGKGDCRTPETSDYTFENPGKYVTKGGVGPYAPLCGGASSGGSQAPSKLPPASPPVNSPAPSSALPKAPIAPVEPAEPSKPVAPTAPAPVSTLHTMVTVTSPLATQTSSRAPAPVSPPAAPTGSKAPAQPSGGPAPTFGTGTTDGTTCSPNGALVCNGETQFGLCNWGKVVWQPVAAGTTCQNGKIARRAYTHRGQRTAI